MVSVSILFIGPAGCGKTSLTKAFGSWLEGMGKSVSYINLDPGTISIPYKADYDVREFVTVQELMEKDSLGPNGAMIRACDIIASKVEEIVERLSKEDVEFYLIDSPGQMELFLFRDLGPKFSESLLKRGKGVAVYILDAELASSTDGIALNLSLALAVRVRLSMPTVIVINKSDKLKDRSLDFADLSKLLERLESERSFISEIVAQYLKIVERFSKAMRFGYVSALTGDGMDVLYDLVNEALCECGDLS